jgi:hypothetical protein
VVYVDNDPAVIIDAQALLSDPHTLSICADLTRPDDIIGHREVRRLIDFSQPVAILVVYVMHVIPDKAGPARLVARLRDVMAPGSYLAISHVEFSRNHLVGNQPLNQTTRELGELRKGLPSAHARTREEITGFFGDLMLVEPGLVDVWAWPDSDCIVTMKDVLEGDQIGWKAMTILGGVSMKTML